MNSEDVCVYRKSIDGELMCSIVKKPISKKCGECGKGCSNFEKEY
jgi:tRNA1(Val) A37 N6-methylase TrmN6